MFTLVKRKDKNKLFTHELHYNGKLYRKSIFFMEGYYSSDFCHEDNTESGKNIPFKEILNLRAIDFPDKFELYNEMDDWETNETIPLCSIRRIGNSIYFAYDISDEQYENEYMNDDLIISFLKRKIKNYPRMTMIVYDKGMLLSFVYTSPCRGKLAFGYYASRRLMNIFYKKEFGAIAKATGKIKKIINSIAGSA